VRRGIDYLFPGVMSASTEARVLAQLDEEMFTELEKITENPDILDQVVSDIRIPNGLSGEGKGGLLDKAAQNVVDAAEKSTKNWASWLGWR
jgi:hypothetical protein